VDVISSATMERVTLYAGDGFVSSTAAPIASGWSEPSSRAGLSPAVDQRLFTAHVLSRFTPSIPWRYPNSTAVIDLHSHPA
jgi:hypothetical protein